MTVFKNLKELRQANNIPQTELAKYLGCTQAYISYVEHGKIEPSLSMALKIANYFNCDIEHLIGFKL